MVSTFCKDIKCDYFELGEIKIKYKCDLETSMMECEPDFMHE